MDMQSPHEPWSLRVSRCYLRGLHRVRYPLMMTWIIMTAIFAIYAAEFPGDVTDTLSAPHDSQAYAATQAYHDHFPEMQDSEGLIVYARSKLKPFNFAEDPRYMAFDTQLMYWAYTKSLDMTGLPPAGAKWVVSTYSSYFTSKAYGLMPWTYASVMAPGNYSTFATITYNKTYTGDDAVSATEFCQQLTDTISILLKRNGLDQLIIVSPLGLSPFLNELNKSTTRDMALLFGLFTPLSLIVFALSIGSLRILILPLAALSATTAFSFGLMHFVASAMDIDSTAPGVAGLLCLGLSVCFAYTFAAKFHRETLDQMAFGSGRGLVVLELVLAYSGRTILVSSLTIVFCSFGIIFFPIGMLKSIGLTCVVSALSALIVSLNFVPVILTCCPRFFERGVGDWIWPRFGRPDESLIKRPRGRHSHDATTALVRAEHDQPSNVSHTTEQTPPRHLAARPAPNRSDALDAPEGPSVLYVHRHEASMSEPLWDHHDTRQSSATRESQRVDRERYFYRYFVAFLAQWQVALPCILLAVGLSMYPMTQADDTDYSNDIDQFMPKDSSLLPEFNAMSQTFRAGEVFQYYMVIRYDMLAGVIKPDEKPFLLAYTPDAYTIGQNIITTLVRELPNTPSEAFDAFFYAGMRTNAPNLTLMGDYYPCSVNPYTPECLYLAITGELFINRGRGPYTWVQVRLGINPLSAEGKTWYDGWKQLAPKLNAQYGVTLYLQGYAADSIDTVAFANDKFPVVVGIVMAILFVSIGLMTLSIGIPARALTTVGITWGTTSGLANMVFCQGVLSWMPLDGLKSTNGALAWLVPFTTLMLVTGLSLHYDMSLVLRVQQFYHHGFDTCSSIVLAAQETGSEISVGAGMMMLLFSGLLLSEVPVMNQLAFYLVMVAFLQGIVYRLFLSTTFMAMLDDWNWFPYNLTRRAQEGSEDSLMGTEAHVAENAQRESAAFRHSLVPAESPRVHGADVQPLTNHHTAHAHPPPTTTGYGTA